MKKKNVLSRCLWSSMPSQCQSFGLCVEPGFTRFQLVSLSLSLRYFLLHGAETARARKGKNILLEFLNLTMKLIFVVDCSVWRRARPASPCVDAVQCIGFR